MFSLLLHARSRFWDGQHASWDIRDSSETLLVLTLQTADCLATTHNQQYRGGCLCTCLLPLLCSQCPKEKGLRSLFPQILRNWPPQGVT